MEVKKEQLRLYLLGAAAVIGAAVVLQKHLGNRVNVTIGNHSNPVLSMTKQEKDDHANMVKEKVKHKEKKVRLGESHFLHEMLGQIKVRAPIKKADVKKRREKLKKAAVDYIAIEMEHKLEHIGMGVKDIEKIVDNVADIAETIIESEDLEKVIRKFDKLDDQIAFLIKRVHPKLVSAIKKKK